MFASAALPENPKFIFSSPGGNPFSTAHVETIFSSPGGNHYRRYMSSNPWNQVMVDGNCDCRIKTQQWRGKIIQPDSVL
jgi:hypothetical protein